MATLRESKGNRTEVHVPFTETKKYIPNTRARAFTLGIRLLSVVAPLLALCSCEWFSLTRGIVCLVGYGDPLRILGEPGRSARALHRNKESQT